MQEIFWITHINIIALLDTTLFQILLNMMGKLKSTYIILTCLVKAIMKKTCDTHINLELSNNTQLVVFHVFSKHACFSGNLILI